MLIRFPEALIKNSSARACRPTEFSNWHGVPGTSYRSRSQSLQCLARQQLLLHLGKKGVPSHLRLCKVSYSFSTLFPVGVRRLRMCRNQLQMLGLSFRATLTFSPLCSA